jgi:acyl-coenzyme A thioesterase PaaI-like protein
MSTKKSQRIIETKPYFIWNFLESFLPPEWFLSLYPIYLASGIKITKVSKDYRHIRVEMDLNIYNRNYVGSHFGGSLFAMTDPFYMLMFLKNLGKEYIVWDKKACIEFIKATTEDVYAEFNLSEETLQSIKEELTNKKSCERTFLVEIKTKKEHDIIAKVEKTLYFRKIKK